MKVFFWFLLLITMPSWAQDTLALDFFLKQALEKNHGILLARNEMSISANRQELRTGALLPSANLIAGGTFASNDTRQEFSSGMVIDKEGVKSNNTNAAISLDWTVFDGFRMFALRDRLKLEEVSSTIALRMQVEETVSQVSIAYYNLSRLQQQKKALQKSLQVSDDRLALAEKKLSLGAAAGSEILQTRIERNRTQSLLLAIESEISKAVAELMLASGLAEDRFFAATLDIPLDTGKVSLSNLNIASNSSVLLTENERQISGSLLKESRAHFYPTLNLSASYLFNKSSNQAGFILFNQNLGNNVGFTATLPLFSGFANKVQLQNAKIQVLSADIRVDEIKSLVNRSFSREKREFNLKKLTWLLEEENSKLAEQYLSLVMERYRLGAANGLELQESQQSFEEALSRLANARFELKRSEINLLNLNGELVR